MELFLISCTLYIVLSEYIHLTFQNKLYFPLCASVTSFIELNVNTFFCCKKCAYQLTGCIKYVLVYTYFIFVTAFIFIFNHCLRCHYYYHYYVCFYYLLLSSSTTSLSILERALHCTGYLLVSKLYRK